MPLIEQEELEELNKKIKTLNNEVEEVEDEMEDVKKHRLMLLIASIVLFLLLFVGLLTYLFSPTSLVSTSDFESAGYKVMTEEEYTQISEILNNQEMVAQDNEGDSNYTDEELSTESYSEDNFTPSTTTANKTIYAVQIAAFADRAISLYSENLIQFKENQVDNYYKYALGAFETLEEAQQFRKELIKLGFRDAFIASYKNGERLQIEAAW